MNFSSKPAARADVRPSHGEYIAQPYDADGVPTESDINVGLIAGSDPDQVAAYVRYVFGVQDVTMPQPSDSCETWRVHCASH